MGNIAICPHCKAEFETGGSLVDAVNVACNVRDQLEPELIENGYKMYFRGYVQGELDDRAFGFCIAYPVDREKDRLFYYSAAGSDVARQCVPGEKFESTGIMLDWDLASTEAPHFTTFVKAKEDAMQRLRGLVAKAKAA